MEQLPHFSAITVAPAPPTALPCYPNGPQDWENHKAEIADLYYRKLLEEVRSDMERQNFRATTKQWKTQLKKWEFKKRIGGDEYKAMLKLKRVREHEQPAKENEFILQGTVVPNAKIARYQANALKNGSITQDDTFPNIAIPPGLSCHTPPNEAVVPHSLSLQPSPKPRLNGSLPSQRPNREGLEQGLPRNQFALDSFTGSSTRSLSSPSFMIASQEKDTLTQRLSESPLRTPPLRAFEWWWSFADFQTFEPPAVLIGPSSKPVGRLLARYSQKIDNYEDACIFNGIMATLNQGAHCEGCTFLGVIQSALYEYAITYSDTRKFMNILGAAIQKLNELKELQRYQLNSAALLVGSGLRILGRYSEAIPLFIEALKERKSQFSHNELALYRLEVAACYVELNQIDEAVEQLRMTFGPEYGRLAIIGPEQCNCKEYGPSLIIDSNLTNESTLHLWQPSIPTESDELADIEVPAGTFCLQEEILPTLAVDEGSTLYSTLFFSTVRLRRRDVVVMQYAAEIVRELHRRSTANLGIKLDIEMT